MAIGYDVQAVEVAPDPSSAPEARVRMVVELTLADAEALAAARVARAPSDLLADQAKPSAHAVADALVAAGYGAP